MSFVKGQRRTALNVALQMPPLPHTVGAEFDVSKSEVVAWLISQPKVLQYIFNTSKALLKYDPTTRLWQGRDYKAPEAKQPWEFT